MKPEKKMKKSLIVLSCLLSAATLGAATFDEVYREGINRMRKGETGAALPLFREAAELADNSARKTDAVLQISLAMPLSREREALQMLLEYRDAAGKLPVRSEACLDLRIGVLQARLKQYEDAVKSLSRALGREQLSERDRCLAYDMLSNSQLHRKQYADALKTLDKWEALDSLSANDYARLLTRRAGLFGVLKRFDEAYKTGTEAAGIPGISPVNQALAWQMLAYVAFANEKDFRKAAVYSEKSRAVKNGKGGFNRTLHEKIRKAAGNGK